TPTPAGCSPAVSPSSISVSKNGGSGTVTLTLSAGGSGTITGSQAAPGTNLTVSPASRAITSGGSVTFTITSNNTTRGNFTVNFTTPCGSTSVTVTVTN